MNDNENTTFLKKKYHISKFMGCSVWGELYIPTSLFQKEERIKINSDCFHSESLGKHLI